MPALTRFWAVWLAAAVILFAAPFQAFADDNKYRKTIAEGVDEFYRGNFAEAKALFQMAHGLNPNARTLRGMGMCAFEMREYVDALALLQKALVHQTKQLTTEQRDQVKGLIVRCRAFIGSYTLELVPAHATVTVDGAPGTTDSGKLLLDPGAHELVVQAEGYRDLARQVHATSGEQGRLKLVLERAATAENTETERTVTTAEAMEEDVPPQPSSTDVPSDSSSGRLWTWVAAGGAGLFATTAVIFWLLGGEEYSKSEEACQQNGCLSTQRVNDEIAATNLETYETLTTASLALSGAMLVGASVLFFVEAPSNGEQMQSVAVGVAPGGVQLGVAF